MEALRLLHPPPEWLAVQYTVLPALYSSVLPRRWFPHPVLAHVYSVLHRPHVSPMPCLTPYSSVSSTCSRNGVWQMSRKLSPCDIRGLFLYLWVYTCRSYDQRECAIEGETRGHDLRTPLPPRVSGHRVARPIAEPGDAQLGPWCAAPSVRIGDHAAPLQLVVWGRRYDGRWWNGTAGTAEDSNEILYFNRNRYRQREDYLPNQTGIRLKNLHV
jgi:hypothetical protein